MNVSTDSIFSAHQIELARRMRENEEQAGRHLMPLEQAKQLGIEPIGTAFRNILEVMFLL